MSTSKSIVIIQSDFIWMSIWRKYIFAIWYFKFCSLKWLCWLYMRMNTHIKCYNRIDFLWLLNEHEHHFKNLLMWIREAFVWDLWLFIIVLEEDNIVSNSFFFYIIQVNRCFVFRKFNILSTRLGLLVSLITYLNHKG